MRKMKNSGVEWIGIIPETWSVKAGKHYLTLLNRKPTIEDQIITCFRDGEVTLRSNRREDGFTFSEKEIGYQGIKKGDLVVHGMDGFAGAIGISDSDGKGTPILNVLESSQSKKYLMYFLRSAAMKGYFLATATGIRVRSCDLRWSKLASMPLLLPPIPEQNAIATYLDSKCSQIDFIVEKTQQEIEKLKEYRQSMITEAVTKGLDPDVEMKDSGVEWIGKVPSNWTVKKLKHVSTHIYKGSGITRDQIFEDGDMPCIRYGDIYTKYNHGFEKVNVFTKQDHISSPKHVSYGDLLFAGTGELVEEIGKSVVYLGHEDCLAGGDIVVVTHTQNPRFMGYATDSLYMQQQKSYGKAKLKVVHISASEIGSLLTALPPLDTQKEIADYLDSECSQIEIAINIKQKIIDKLRQYKKSLIYECVTGKKEVPSNA